MNLYVGNLSPETSEKDLTEAFSEFGQVLSVKVLIDPATGMPRGFGFVEMAGKGEGFDAIMNLDCTYLKGTIISVKEARAKGDNSNDRPRRRPSFQPRDRDNRDSRDNRDRDYRDRDRFNKRY